MRVELTRPIGHYPLKVARLPIPPHPDLGKVVLYQLSYFRINYGTVISTDSGEVQRTRAKDGTRTRDPDLGKVVLYQLSYFRSQF